MGESSLLDWGAVNDAREAAHDAASAAAAKRVGFQLTYGRAPELREFSRNEIDGPSLPNAYDNDGGLQAGEWSDFDDPDEATEEAWIDKYAGMAINEAVHEALEWFRLDGKPWLDPHGRHEAWIFQEVNALAKRLAGLRRGEFDDA